MKEEEVTVKVKDEEPKVWSEEDLQQKLILYQLLERQAETLKQHIQTLEQRVFEINSTKEAISSIKSAGVNEIIIPLGSGIYIQGEIKSKTFITDIGAGLMVEKDKLSAKKHIDGISKQLDDSYKEVEKQLTTVIEKVNEIALEVQDMSRQMQAAQSEEE